MFIGVFSEALLWALFYLYSPEITRLPDLETALYFSMVTFTSVGYGDVVLPGPWRILTSIQAANGVIIFGWTTALIFYHMQTVYARK
jgi:voltage-gated potassium channel Kch